MEAALRNMKYIEYNHYFKTSPDKKNLTVLKTYLDSIFTVKNTGIYLKNQFAKYLVNKPKQREFEETSEIMRSEVYKMAHPSDHQFIITTVQSNIH